MKKILPLLVLVLSSPLLAVVACSDPPEPSPAPSAGRVEPAGHETCQAYPSCDPGDVEVQTPSACDGAPAYRREMCGRRIWCCPSGP